MEQFAKSFIETTIGWDCGGNIVTDATTTKAKAKEAVQDDDKYSDDNQHHQQKQYYCWIDDRADPWYVRADPEFSNSNKDLIDTILKESIPTAFENRVLHYHKNLE